MPKTYLSPEQTWVLKKEGSDLQSNANLTETQSFRNSEPTKNADLGGGISLQIRLCNISVPM
jgi:hypothetical protein